MLVLDLKIKTKMNFEKFAPLFIILIAVVARLVPHIPNFTPIAATALFGAVYLPRKYAFIIPLSAMLISDFFIGFHSTMIYVYGSFILITLIGLWIRTHKSPQAVIGGALSSSVLFFLITNFGVWAAGGYARDISGLATSYIMGIPFFRPTLLGDLFYTGVFFGGYELVTRFVKSHKLAFTSR